MGFCVAMTKKGSGSGRVTPSAVTLALLHGLEQRRLGLGGRAVDLVGQQELREHRARWKTKRVLLLVEDVAAGDVAGIRSGVNWMRLNVQPSTCASVRTSSVLPRPARPR